MSASATVGCTAAGASGSMLSGTAATVFSMRLSGRKESAMSKHCRAMSQWEDSFLNIGMIGGFIPFKRADRAPTTKNTGL